MLFSKAKQLFAGRLQQCQKDRSTADCRERCRASASERRRASRFVRVCCVEWRWAGLIARCIGFAHAHCTTHHTLSASDNRSSTKTVTCATPPPPQLVSVQCSVGPVSAPATGHPLVTSPQSCDPLCAPDCDRVMCDSSCSYYSRCCLPSLLIS